MGAGGLPRQRDRGRESQGDVQHGCHVELGEDRLDASTGQLPEHQKVPAPPRLLRLPQEGEVGCKKRCWRSHEVGSRKRWRTSCGERRRTSASSQAGQLPTCSPSTSASIGRLNPCIAADGTTGSQTRPMPYPYHYTPLLASVTESQHGFSEIHERRQTGKAELPGGRGHGV